MTARLLLAAALTLGAPALAAEPAPAVEGPVAQGPGATNEPAPPSSPHGRAPREAPRAWGTGVAVVAGLLALYAVLFTLVMKRRGA